MKPQEQKPLIITLSNNHKTPKFGFKKGEIITTNVDGKITHNIVLEDSVNSPYFKDEDGDTAFTTTVLLRRLSSNVFYRKLQIFYYIKLKL